MSKYKTVGSGKKWTVIQADVMDYLEGSLWLRQQEGVLFHAVLFDPPYHLTGIVNRFGKENSAPAKFGRDGAFARQSRGFMGQTWDGGDLVFRPELWSLLGQHLYPGAFGMAFASSRGWHRMAAAIEDAGLIIHPSIFGWVYLSGFPKATRIDTQVDKAAGVDVGKGKAHPAFAPRKAGYRTEEFATNGHGDGVRHLAQSPLAQTWQGHRYGLQALKPALEPIIVFQRPYEGKPVRDIVTTGAGALNIDGGRIGTADNLNGGAYSQSIDGMSQNEIYGKYYKKPGGYNAPSGRWPANFVLECPCDAIDWCDCDDDRKAQIDCPVRLFDEQAGESTERGFDDSGPASRMFHRSDWSHEIAERLAQADPVRYEPKASSAERGAGLDSLATQTRRRVNSGGLENEPRFAPTEVKNPHPTVKPISLTKYLATLLLPPQEYQPRRILVPFAGVGSEMIGAILAGWDEVTGIELDREGQYLPVTQARLKWWSQWPGFGQTDPSTILAANNDEPGQIFMFADE